MKTIKSAVVAAFAALLFLMAESVMAGEITGRIFFKDGSTCSSCRISASIKRSGMTGKVFTDNKGYFKLTWSSNNSIDELYVDGKKEREDIPSGDYVEIRLK
jgi:hypothetical protein